MRHFLSLMMLLVALCVPWVTQAQVSVPYTEDFEGTSLIDGWTVLGGTVAPATGTPYQGSKSLKFSSSLRNIIALPEFTSPVNTLQLSFWTRPEGTYANSGQFDVGYLTDITDTSTFVALETYDYSEFSGAYQQKVLYLANVPVSARLALRQRPVSDNYYWFVDNLEVKLIPTCFPVSNLVFSNLTPQGADLSWTPNSLGTESQYQVCCVPFGTTPNWDNATLVNTTSITFTGLNTYSVYEAYVRSYCSSSDQSEDIHAMFMTSPDCGTASLRQFSIGNSNTSNTTYYAPFVSYNSTSTSYKNGASWQIFTGDELVANDLYEGNINGIALQPDGDASIPFQIFIGHTTKDVFESSTDTINRATLTKVYDGTYPFDADQEWNEIIFDTPFAYDGHSNIVVMFYRPEPAVTATLRFKYTSPGFYRTIYRYGATVLSSGSYSTSYRSNMRFTMCVNVPTCLPATDIAFSNITSSSADLAWTSDAGSFIVAYGEGIDPEEMQTVTATANSITLSGLTSNTQYNVFVKSVCSDTDQGPWSRMATFLTNCDVTAIPWSENFETLTLGNSTAPAPDCWALLNANEGTYPYCYVNNTSTYVSEGTKSLYFASSNTAYAYAILPPFNTPLNQLQVSYKCNFENPTSSGYMTLGYMTNSMDESTFVPVFTAERLADKAFSVCEVALDSIPLSAANARLAFRYGGTTSSNYYAGLDELSVTLLPTCKKPTNVVVSNITSASATISWTSNEGNFAVAYGAGTNPDEMQTVSASTTSAELTGLTPNTEYNVFVKAVCSATDESEWSLIQNFKTACLPFEVSDLPLSENFDNVTTSTTTDDLYQLLPDCWNLVEMEVATTTASYFPRLYNSTSYTTSGSYCLYMNYRAKVALPYINADLNTLQLDLSVRQSSASYKLVVGAMSDLSDATTFVAIDTISCSSTSATEHFNVKLNSYTGNGHYIVLRNYNTSSTTNYAYNYIDDVTISLLPACIEPTDVVISNLEATGATISWTSDASNFTMAYGTGTNVEEMQTITTTANSVTLTGLNEATTYNVFVKAICSATDESEWSTMATFTTPCLTVALPFEENFDTRVAGEIVSCWDNSMSTTTTLSGTPAYVWGVYTYGGNNMIRMYNYYVQSGVAAINTPSIVLPANGIYELKFDVSHHGSNGNMIVKVTTDDGTTYTNLDTITNESGSTDKDNPGTFVPVTLDLTAFAGNTINVQFWTNADYGSGSIFIDNVIVREAPSCVEPTDVVVSNVDGNNATISWTGSASSYTVAYGEGTEPATMQTVTATANTVTLTGLTPATVYNVFVKATCSATEESGWSAMATFSTPCGMIDLPYEEGFEALTSMDNTCWDFYMNDASSYVDIVTSTSSEGTHSLVLDSYDCSGTDDTIYAALPLFDSINYGYLAFDYRLSGSSSSYGSVSLGYLTNPSDFTTFTLISQLPQTTSFTSYTYKLSNLPADAQRLVISYDNYYRAWIDNVRITRDAYVDVTMAQNDAAMGTTTPATGVHRYNVGETVTLTATPNAGYQFLNWVVGDTTIADNPYQFVISDDYAFSSMQINAVFDMACATPTNVVASNVTATGAHVSWTGTADSYIVAYGEGTDPDNMTTVTANTEEVDLTGLTPVTTYNVFVKGICTASGNSGWSVMGTFTTPCASYTLPYNEDFENRTVSQVAPCWDNSMSTSSTLTGSPSYIWGVYAYGGNNMIRMYNYLVQSGDAVINTPAIELPANGNYQLKFDVSHQASCGNLLVKVTTDDGDSYTIIDTITTNGSTDRENPGTFVPVTLDLTAFAGNTVKVQFWTHANYGSGAIFVDNIMIRETPSCAEPLDVVASNIDAHSATVSWTSSATNFLVAYGEGTDPETMQTVTATTNSATITGLNSATTYHVFVKAICSATDQSTWSAMSTFLTGCDVYTLPYSEDFENRTVSQVAPCWDNSMSTSSTLTSYPYYIWGVYTTAGNNMIRMYNYYVQSGIAAINTPSIVLPANGNYQLKFDYSHRASCGDLSVKVTTDGVNYTNVGTLPVTNTSFDYTNPGTFVPVTLDLSAFAGNTINVQFFANANYGSGAIFIDNILVRETPSCLEPTDVVVSDVTANSATVSWTSSATNFVVAYGEGTDPEQMDSVTATTNSITLSGLDPMTTYNVYVKAICSATDQSTWSTMATFGTLCGGIQIPYYEGFETLYNLGNACWDFYVTSSSSYVAIDPSEASEGNRSMVLDSWDASQSDIIFAVLPEFDSIQHGYLMFDYQNYDEGDMYGYITLGFYTDDINNRTNIITLPQSSTFAHYVYDLSNLPDSADRLFIAYNNYYRAWIDNVQILRDTATAADSAIIALAVNDATMGTINPVAGNYTLAVGETFTATATANAGYHFVNWTVNGAAYATTAALSYTVADADADQTLNIVANFVQDSATIVLAVNDATMGTINPVAGNYALAVGETFTATATANTGYHFVNWTVNGATYATTAALSYTIAATDADQTLNIVANFVQDSATIVLAVNDATMGTINPVAGTYRVAVGETVSATATANTGYHFLNWTINGTVEGTNATLSVTVPATAADQTFNVVANFEQDAIPEPDSATVILAVNDAAMGTVSPVAGTYRVEVGETFTATATANTGYHFLNWTINGTVEGTNTTLTMTVPATAADQTFNVVANFEQDAIPEPDSATVILAVNYDVMGTISPVAGTYRVAVGENFTAAATANEGFHFVSWTLNNADFTTELSCTLLISESDANATLNLTAVFAQDVVEPVAHAVNVIVMDTNNNQGVGGTVTGAGNYYPGETVTLTATAAAGYTFVGWTDGANLHITDNPYTFTMGEEDIQVYAVFAQHVGINDAEMDNVIVFSQNGNIVIRGADGHTLYVYDAVGRLLSHTVSANVEESVKVPATGVYIVKIDSLGTRRVVVKR